jgi:hypothetical protein
MKLSGKWREIFDPRTGTLRTNSVPSTRQGAFAEDVAVYYPMETCAHCGADALVFTKTDTCKGCAHRDFQGVYSAAKTAGEPLDPDTAQNANKDYYFRCMIFEYCGHLCKSTLDGKCYECQSDGPRDTARKKGETWYKPRHWDVCKKVHEGSLRRVYDRACKQCLDEKAASPESAPVVDIRAGWPEDQVLERNTAREMGLKIFRTGKPCRRGHVAWRYVSNGGCLVCMGKVAP